MTVVGEASILIRPITTGFDEELKAQTSGSFTNLARDGEAAGANTGAGIRRGVTSETGKLASDLERDGTKAGEGLSKGVSGGLAKLSNVLGATGIPALGGFQSGLAKAGEASDHASSRATGLAGTLDKLGKVALLGTGAALVGTGALALDLGAKMQTADVSIANASGTSVKAATQIGDAFLKTKVAGEYSGQAMAAAYAGVAGQLKQTQGSALTTAQAVQFMAGAGDLARASQVSLGDATSDAAGVMQAFGTKAGGAAHTADTLYSTSRATGLSLDTLTSTLERLRGKLGDSAGSLQGMSALLIDMRDQGISGRQSTTALSSAMTGLEKTSNAVQKAQADVKTSFQALSPTAQALVKGYSDGSVTLNQYATQVKNLSPNQQALLNAYGKSVTTLQTANQAQKQLGVTVFDAQGKFVGMASIIDQLSPKFATMTHQQQLATAAQIFGTSAASQMVAVIDAGPKAFTAAAQTAGKMGTAHQAAAAQAKTLAVQVQTLEATASNIATQFGQVLIPIVQKVGSVFVTGTQYVLAHKGMLIALAAVVGGVLTTAITVFTVNKMAAFVSSFKTAGSNLDAFAGKIRGTASTTESQFATMETDADDGLKGMAGAMTSAAESIEASAKAIVASLGTVDTALEGTASTAETQLGLFDTAMEGAGTSASGMSAKVTASAATVETTVGTEAAAVTTADTTIEADNVAAGASFTALLGPIAAVVAAVVAAQGTINSLTGGGLAPGIAAPPKTAAERAALEKKLISQGVSPAQAKVEAAQAGQGGYSVNPTSAAPAANAQVARYAPLAAQIGAQYGIPPSVLLAQIQEESGGNPNAVSPSGAFGLTQFEPGTAKEYGVQPGSSVAAIRSQVIGEAKYLNALGYQKDPRAALAGYLSGTPGDYTASDGNSTGASYADTILGSAKNYAPLFGGATSASPTGLSSAPATAGRGVPASPYTYTAGGLPISTGPAAPPSDAQLKAAEKHQAAVEAAATKAQAKIEAAQTQAAKQEAEAQKRAADQQVAEAKKQTEAAKEAAKQQTTATTKAQAEQTAAAKKADAEIAKAHQTGVNLLDKLLTATHAGSLKQLQTTLEQVHKAGLAGLEKELDADHKTALSGLSAKLVAAHKEALATLGKELVAAQIAADQKLQLAEMARSGTLATDQAAAQAQQIADAEKVRLDTMAQTGAPGSADLTAQVQQTQYDQLVGEQDKLVSQAQIALDGTDQSNKVAYAQAQQNLTYAQSQQTVVLANAQALLDTANATATATDAAAQAAATAQQTAASDTATAAAAAVTASTTASSDAAKNAAQAIADQTKVTLDQQAQTGLTGTALVAAQAQTAYDSTVQATDAAIAQAQTLLDQDTVNGGPLAQDQAGLASAQNAQTVAEAMAQSVLDQANAANGAATSTSTTPTAAAAAAAVQPTYIININGTNLSGSQVMSEVAFALKVGSLPVAPTPVAA